LRDALLFAGVFLACAVEAVEALTIVLAVGVTREWRSTLQGTVAAFAALAAVVAVLGPALTAIPLDALRLVVGALLLVFGLQWLRKAILRASGFKARHDETAAFAAQVQDAATAPRAAEGPVADWYAFTVAFKGVLLEGLEVAFIVVTVGANQHDVVLPTFAALAAAAAVVLTGVVVRAPLSRVPENTLKFAVGVLLTSFGTFWGGEGAGVRWPGGDAALPVVVAAVAGFSLLLVGWLRREHRSRATPALT
jgi:uncharacterized membrane protein